MPSTPKIDLEGLLQPIPKGDNPSGISLEYTPQYKAIELARAEGSETPEAKDKEPEWPKIITQCSDLLKKQSKDLMIAVWLTEALMKQHGYAGLRDGIQLLGEIQERFWDTLYPPIDKKDGGKDEEEVDDLGRRGSPLNWLNEKLVFPIKSIPFTKSEGPEEYSYWSLEETQRTDQQAVKERKVSPESFKAAVSATPLSFSQPLLEDLHGCWENLQRLKQINETRYASDPEEIPSLGKILETVEEIGLFLNKTVVDKGGKSVWSPSEENQGEGDEQTPGGPPPQKGGGIIPQDRHDAFRRLNAIADFFRDTEPHSPIAYLIQRAANWGSLSFEQWLQEVIKSKETLGAVRETLGLPKEDKPS